MININDKNGKLTIQIKGGKIQNLLTINEIVEDLSKTDEDIASAFIFGVVHTRGVDFVNSCLKRYNKARENTDKMFKDAKEEDIENIVETIKKILNGEDDE
jgi:hypothetical protein